MFMMHGEFSRAFFSVVGKPALDKSDLIEFMSQFSELRCGRN